MAAITVTLWVVGWERGRDRRKKALHTVILITVGDIKDGMASRGARFQTD